MIQRFRFDFADLAPPSPAPRLHVLADADTEPVPAGLVAVSPSSSLRPWWLGSLLPVFLEGEALRVRLHAAAAPVPAERLAAGLSAVLATAGATHSVAVAAWPGHLLVGRRPPLRMPIQPHVHLVTAELWPGSVALALDIARGLPPERTLLVLNGRARRAEPGLGIPEGDRVVRLPLVRPADLTRAPQRLACRRWELTCAAQARRLMAAYGDQQS